MSLTIPTNTRAELDKTSRKWAFLWKVIRRDRTKFYWTNHDQELLFQNIPGQVYKPTASLNVASVRQESDGSVTNTTLQGVIKSDDVEADEVRAGLWQGAQITQRIVNWEHPWKGEILQTRLFIAESSWDGEKMQFQVEGVSHFLLREFGIFCSRPCRHKVFGGAFGQASTVVGCRYDVKNDTDYSNPVDAIVTDRISFDFDSSSMASQADGYYDHGTISFVSGANVGVPPLEIDTYTDTNRRVVLKYPAPFEVAVDDRANVSRGCDREWDSCLARSQTDNYLGFRHMPTEADLRLKPRDTREQSQ